MVIYGLWRHHVQARYDRETSRYHQGAYKRNFAGLLRTFDSTLSFRFLKPRNLRRVALVSFMAGTGRVPFPKRVAAILHGGLGAA